ncbi:MAG TPA: type II toxin-antitoxin system RelE/ParE family toxin [Stellaceae bacterium]|jgi:hypothetical protein|nr:type II toxin-antitoxin system RelE/ParE family toxin [Stellaceae bacterium]
MKVIIRGKAADDLDQIYSWIAKDNPRAARDMVLRVHDRIARLELEALAHMGARVGSKGPENSSNTPTLSFTRSPLSAMKLLSFPSFMVPVAQNGSLLAFVTRAR